MDTYSIAFSLPRATGTHFLPDAPPSNALSRPAADSFSADDSATTVSGSSNTAKDTQSDAPQQPVGSRLRSRFAPSVKSFIPMSFKKTGEKEQDEDKDSTPIERLARSSAEWRKSRLKSTSSLPLSVPEEKTTDEPTSPSSSSNLRDSRSTAGTRSSLDFSSLSNDSTAPSTAPGSKSWQTKSETPSSNHSASNSITTLGAQHPLTSKDVAEAAQRLSLEVMTSTQCHVSCTPAQEDVSPPPSATARQQTGFSPYTSAPNYPYSHYAQGFGHEASAAGFYPGFDSSTASLPHDHQMAAGSAAHSSAATTATAAAKQKMPRYNFHISGTFAQVMEARAKVLRDSPFRSRVTLKVPRAEIIDNTTTAITTESASQPQGETQQSSSSGDSVSPSTSNNDLKPHVRVKLDEIAQLTSTHIAIVGKDSRGADLGYGLETERCVEVVISGELEGVEYARIKTLVMLEELSGLTSMMCEIDQKFHNILGGRKRAVLQTIQEQTGTSIYLPLPLSINLGASQDPAVLARLNTIHISGDYMGVQRAREMVFQVFFHKSKSTISRDTAILPRKIDWLLTDHLEDLRQIMIDNGTFIGLPALGAQSSVVTVYGDNRVSIERTIRTVMALACQFYVSSLWLLPQAYSAMNTPMSLNSPQLTTMLQNVANRSGAEVVFKGNCFEIHGLETEVKGAISMVLDLDVIKQFNFEVRFQIELATSEREFLQGRKCGKVNKIMKQCGVRIKFETLNDYNFLVELSSNDRASALQGLALLQEELPAEVSFHVPEAYHKRCIGVGGKQIQKVMKKYGVYVKFSNAEEFAALGGYLDNEDNVIARTPAKNAINLENLKQSVMEMVNPKDKDYTTETVSVSRRYHRALLGEKAIFIHDIESKTSSKVYFPPREAASDLVAIFGPESQIHIASAMLLEHVPFEAEFRTPNAASLGQVVGSQEFVALTERVKRDLSIHILAGLVPPPESSAEAIFKLRLSRSNHDFLPTAKDMLEDFLTTRNINVYAAPARARSDSFASSFPHFATKLISTPGAGADQSDAASFHSELAARFNDTGRLRGAASSPALKALFDSPAAGRAPFPTASGGGMPTSGSGSSGTSGVTAGAGASNSPLVGSSLYTSPYADAMPGGVSSEVWGTPRGLVNSITTPTPPAVGSQQQQQSLGTPSHSPVSSTSGIVFPPHHTARQSEDATLLHRNTEPFGSMPGGGADERTRSGQLRKPRSFAHRAQSLDISSRAAQQAALEASAAYHGGGAGSGGSGVGGYHPHGGYSSGGISPGPYYNGPGGLYGPASGGYHSHVHTPSGYGGAAHQSYPFNHHGGHVPSPSMPRVPHATQSMSSHTGGYPYPRQPIGGGSGPGGPSGGGGSGGGSFSSGPVDDMTRMLNGFSFHPSS